jgi:hypothetical protein
MLVSAVAHFAFDLRTGASPEAVWEALIDFSDRRPDLWPGLPRHMFEVYEVGETSAEVREGYRGPIWVRERYDWSVPGTVVWTAVESGFAMPGKRVVATIEPTAVDGGAAVHLDWDGTGQGLLGKLFVGFMVLTRGFFIRRSVQSGLDRIEAMSGHND